MPIELIQGDITEQQVDAIVNAANSGLMGGGGVDGAIHRAGGPTIMDECDAIRARQGGCPTGKAVATTAGKLPARWVIHTAGPVWQGGHRNEEARLAACYRNSLRLAEELGARSVAFPGISTGIYGFPKEPAARIAIAEVRAFLAEHALPEKVVFVCFDRGSYDLYAELLT
jgi:O-acetyl-ADP-ribose deacetylase (regulator of RNase III)